MARGRGGAGRQGGRGRGTRARAAERAPAVTWAKEGREGEREGGRRMGGLKLPSAEEPVQSGQQRQRQRRRRLQPARRGIRRRDPAAVLATRSLPRSLSGAVEGRGAEPRRSEGAVSTPRWTSRGRTLGLTDRPAALVRAVRGRDTRGPANGGANGKVHGKLCPQTRGRGRRRRGPPRPGASGVGRGGGGGGQPAGGGGRGGLS